MKDHPPRSDESSPENAAVEAWLQQAVDTVAESLPETRYPGILDPAIQRPRPSPDGNERPDWVRAPWAGWLAAAAVVCVFSYPAYLGVSGAAPGTTAPAIATVSSPSLVPPPPSIVGAGRAAIVDLQVWRPITRSASSEPREIDISEISELILKLRIDWLADQGLGSDVHPQTMVRIEVLDDTGPVWEYEETRAEALKAYQTEDNFGIPAILSVDRLKAPSDCTVVVYRETHGSWTEVGRKSFKLVHGGDQADRASSVS